MRGVATLAVVVAGLAFVGGADAVSPSFTAARLSSADVRRMVGTSWHRGCPVALADLRLVTATYWGFDKRAHTGRIVVHRDVAADVLAVLRRLYAARLPDPAHGAGRRLRRLRLPLDRGRQHVRLQLPLRRRHDALVGARVRPRDRRQPDREPVRHVSAARPRTRRAARTCGARRTAPAWRSRAARSSARSTRVGWGWGGRWSGATRLPALLGERSLSAKRSGRPGSNRRHSAWKADALPTELHPHGSSVAP